MGVMDWMEGDDEESDTLATDGLGFDDELDDEMGDLDGEMGDLDGGDDLGGMDDDFGGDDLGGMGGDLDGGDDLGGMDDDFGGGGGDDFGGSEVDAETIAEMEDRISELENEVSSISSGMNTVREENKQIGETVEELDETIRKLLDIYEMVTRGINPFVDDAREMGGLEGDGAFGLFEMEEESEEDLDGEVANADAESFFDEDFGDLDADEDEAELAAEDELADEERTDPAEALDGDAEDETDDGGAGGGSSFDDLKAEYEENEGWDDLEEEQETDESEADGDDDGEFDGMQDHVGDDLENGDGFEAAAEDEVEEVEPDQSLFEAGAEPEPEADGSEPAEPTPAGNGTAEPATNGTAEPAANGTSGHTARESADSDAYLTELPARYTAESVVLEWTRFLVDVGGAIGAARALRQYRSQEWITRDVERTMCEHVRNAATAGETERPRDLRVEHHRESLTYISRLAGGVDESRLLEELSALGGGSRGIRR